MVKQQVKTIPMLIGPFKDFDMGSFEFIGLVDLLDGSAPLGAATISGRTYVGEMTSNPITFANHARWHGYKGEPLDHIVETQISPTFEVHKMSFSQAQRKFYESTYPVNEKSTID